MVIGALALAHYLWDQLGTGTAPMALRDGLFAWDAHWYREIAELGYQHSTAGNLRFFPLYPIVGRGLGAVLVGRTDVALLGVANLSGLVFGGLLHRVVIRETGDVDLARRSVWFAALLPQMYVLVLGYSEGLLLAVSVGFFLCLRRRWWYWAGLLGVLAGLTRPTGVLLAVAAIVEGIQRWPESSARERVAMGAAVAGPAVGIGLFLAWSAQVYDDFLAPLRIQQIKGLRGHFVDPVTSLYDSFKFLVHGDHLGAGAHVLWAPVVVLFVVAAARRLPASYTLYTVAVVLLALASENISSFERYSMSAFPVIIGAGVVTARPRDLYPAVLGVSTAALLGLSVLVYLGYFVP